MVIDIDRLLVTLELLVLLSTQLTPWVMLCTSNFLRLAPSTLRVLHSVLLSPSRLLPMSMSQSVARLSKLIL